MKRLFKRSMFSLIVGVIASFGLLISTTTLSYAQGGPVSTPHTAYQTAEEVISYWTPERMRDAIPMPMPKAIIRGDEPVVSPTHGLPEDAYPGYAPGWDPNSGLPQPDPMTRIEIIPDSPLYEALFGAKPMAFGSPPSNPVDYPNYGKFARWTWYGRYLTYPTSTIGKLFFSMGGVNYECSASVIGRSTIATAGHCVSSGASTWGSNFLFCPSYYKAGINPARGCWAGVQAWTTAWWHYNGNVDRDYACIVTATTGTIISNKVGNVTGWTGRAFNWGSTDIELTWGYPVAPPFPGYHIITVAGNEWYSVNMDSGDSPDLASKYIGSDMTGGSSGGPWWLGTRHPNSANNYADTDSVLYTGWVGGPWINGVNSHKRCLVNCSTPPSATAGVYWQEMGSPPFTSSGIDNNDSEDIFGECLSHPNNNP